MGQSWFDAWEATPPHHLGTAGLKIADLMDEGGQGWNRAMIASLMGSEAASTICRSVPPPQGDTLMPDRLICDRSTSGTYSVKQGYADLTDAAAIRSDPVWELI
jgi:hypothetical protein